MQPSAKPAGQRLRVLWPDIWALVKPRRGILAIGFVLMIINRVAGLVLPASTKFLIDDVVTKHNLKLLMPIVLSVLAATAIQGLTSFSLTQLLSKAAQRLIAEMRAKVQEHIGRLSIAYFDGNKTGTLVSRIMNDVEGVRNLIGTGLVDFVGGLITALLAVVILIRISVVMTGIAVAVILCFTVVLQRAFKTIRPIFRERGKITAEVTGRLTESLGGVRVIKGYHAEQREAKVFSTGVQRLLANVMQSLTDDLTSGANYATGIQQNRTDLNVGLSKQFLNDRVTVTVGNNFNLEGQNQPGQKTTDIAGNISVNYKLTKDGRYLIRIYRRDEFIVVEGQVIETGVGFSLTYEYNHFKELFAKKPAKDKEMLKEYNKNQKEQKKEQKAADKKADSTVVPVPPVQPAPKKPSSN